MKKILVWDVPTRLVHWLLVVSFAGAFATADSERLRHLHILFGVTMLVAILFRLVWGLTGTRYARFASFAFGPRAVLRYLGGLATLRTTRHVGHPPAASWAIWLMLLTGLAVGLSGYAAQTGGGDALEEAHEALAWSLLTVVVVHVAGVLLASVLHRENLVAAMITGRKRGDAREGIRRSRWLVGAVLAALVVAIWLQAVPVPGLDRGRTASLGTVHHEDD
jgi:cytochrome b